MLPFCTVLKRFCATLCFPAFFLFSLKGEMAATDNKDSTTEKQIEQESSTLIAVLNSMKASIESGNSLLQELVTHKRSSPDDETQASNRKKSCSASQTANAMSSDEDENDASEKANTQHHHNASEADALSFNIWRCRVISMKQTIPSSRIWRMETLTTQVCCLQSTLS